MKNRILLLLFVAVCSGVNKGLSQPNFERDLLEKDASKKFNAKVQSTPNILNGLKIMRRTADLARDTNNMNPIKMDAQITYLVNFNSKDKGSLQKQMDFLVSSGFPSLGQKPSAKVLNESSRERKSLTAMNVDASTLTLEEADFKYRDFVRNNSDHPYLTVFKQNAAQFIIRKFLIGKPAADRIYLKYYTNELITAGSQDYAIIYYLLSELKGELSKSTLENYKASILNDKTAVKYRSFYENSRNAILEKSKTATGAASELLAYEASLYDIPLVRRDHFMNKIKNL